MKNRGTCLIAVIAVVFLIAGSVLSDDWPQWRGVNRDGCSKETGLLKTWPADGPKELWSVETAGEGYAGVSVVGEAVLVTGTSGEKAARKGILYCLSAKDGSIRWQKEYGAEWGGSYDMARTTPTIDGGKIYLFSGMGSIYCYKLSDGALEWSVDTMKEYGGKKITWGFAESPLILKDMVICQPGGKDSSVVALKKASGKLVWRSTGLSDASAYCSAFAMKVGTGEVILTQTADNIVGMDGATGNVFWKFPHRNKYAVHPNTPVVFDSKVFIASGYGYGAELLKLSPDGKKAEVLWKSQKLDNHFQGAIHHEGRLYESCSGGLVCIDPEDGKVVYNVSEVRKGAILLAEGRIYAYDEKGGRVSLVEVSPDKYSMAGSFTVTKGNGPHWAHPALANGVLYIRHGATLMAYDVKAQR